MPKLDDLIDIEIPGKSVAAMNRFLPSYGSQLDDYLPVDDPEALLNVRLTAEDMGNIIKEHYRSCSIGHVPLLDDGVKRVSDALYDAGWSFDGDDLVFYD